MSGIDELSSFFARANDKGKRLLRAIMHPGKGLTTALCGLDTVLNSLMILLALRIERRRISAVRVLAGAFLGAVLAGVIRSLAPGRMMTAALWFPCAAAMMAVAAHAGSVVQLLRSSCVLLCAAGLLGGVVQAFLGAAGSLPWAYALGAAALLVIAGCSLRTAHAAYGAPHARLTIIYRGKSAQFDAIVDSGNTLRDYLTHMPVIVLPCGDVHRRLIGEGEMLRPIFADTAGGRMMMECATPQEVRLNLNGKTLKLQAVMALSPGMRRGTPALVPSALIGGSEAE